MISIQDNGNDYNLFTSYTFLTLLTLFAGIPLAATPHFEKSGIRKFLRNIFF